jgi:hypothetical protein
MNTNPIDSKTNKTRWDQDAIVDKDGNTGPTSYEFLLETMRSEKRINGKSYTWYELYCGIGGTGISKITLCQELSLRLQDAGHHRDKTSIQSKINDMISRYKKAYKWLHQTGQGLILSGTKQE